jgi:flagellar basal-body rod protein FlgB
MIEWLSKSTGALESGLNAAWFRGETIQNNIANIDTPGYKAYRVSFEDMLQEAIGSQSVSVLDQRGALSITPQISQNEGISMRIDGNNVDIEQETGELARNTIWYDTMVTKINQEFDRLRLAITGGQ